MAERPLSARGTYAARPTVRIDGAPNERVTELLLRAEMNEWEGGLSSLEARFSNVATTRDGAAELAFEDERLLRLGASIAIYAGEETSPAEVFRGTITGIEAEFSHTAPPELVVLAEDVFQLARMKRRTREHRDVTLADLCRDLAGEVGLTPVIDGLDDAIGTRLQLNESDLAFVRRLLRDYDADLQVVGTELHAARRGDARRGEIELALFGQLVQLRALADLAHQATEVTVSGWDAVQGRRVAVSSRGARLGPGQGTTGAQALSDTLGERREHLGHVAVLDRAEAQALADAHFDQRARRFVTIEATTQGNPELRVGTHVRLTGAGERWDNTYYVVRVRHRYDVQRGYYSDFEAECAYFGGGS